MNLSMQWLSDYVKLNVPDRTFAEAMTMSGSKVETTTHLGAEIERVVVGQIESIEKHPDADKLQICMLSVGEAAPIQIVTGAQNVHVGDLVPVALDGSRLPGGVKIKTGKLRGVQSCGMLCSFHELGLNLCNVPYADENGILLLQENCQVGDDIRDVLGLNDTVVEFEITSNRPDCFSVLGLAREVAATFEKPFTPPTPQVRACDERIDGQVQVTVEAPELCPRYTARMVRDVKVAPSPMWLRARLHAAGVRPVNNIVDITNYVMLEYGQPMHAFDASHVKNNHIIVRRAENRQKFTTLDEVEHTLTDRMLVIADEAGPVAIAGVMGGLNSEIEADTATVIFESATFDAASVRTTARDLGMRTDASALYEKGLDAQNTIPAVDRACELVELLGAGRVLAGYVDVDHSSKEPTTIPFEPERINALLGTQLAADEMIALLARLSIRVEGGMVIVPSFRPDLLCMADIAEEVARLYGYNNIRSTLMRGESTQGGLNAEQKFQHAIGILSRGLGYSECMTYSYDSPKTDDLLALAPDSPLRRHVVIKNPLGDESSVMRTTMLPSMLETLARNYNNRNASADLYELARVYLPTDEALPDEAPTYVIGSYGKGRDFYTLKGALEALFHALAINDVSFEPEKNDPTWHPGRCARIYAGDALIGTIGQIHPKVAAAFGLDCEVYLAELSVRALYAHRAAESEYVPLPKFPAVTRDLALVCDRDLPVAHLEKCIRRQIGKLLENVTLFDVYTGEQVAPDKKSVAYAIVLRAADHTLTDEEVDGKLRRALDALASEFGATLRA